MEALTAYIPIDRYLAMAGGQSLPDHSHGAVLFADISGFTLLTEALTRELGPRRGAEELTRQLNAVYGALIAEVHAYRGSVISFSGDAITCWFDHDDGLRAITCALAMHEVMRQFTSIITPLGSIVSLAIKAAIAVGAVRRFLVGDLRILCMDTLVGSTLDRLALAEHEAHKGELVAGSEVVALLGDMVQILEWRTDSSTGERFAVVTGLVRQADRDPWPALPTASLAEEQLRPWLHPPVYERIRTGQGQFLAELRPTITLFLCFGGIDYDQDAAAGAKLDAYICWVQHILAAYEGYMLQLMIGDKGNYLYAAFGALITHDDDASRAVAAAVKLQSPPLPLAFISGVQIGISRGQTWVGAYGGPTRRTYGVLGDEVNLAARLMQQAKPGQILVGGRVAAAAMRSHLFQSIGLISVKGKRDPVAVYRVGGERMAFTQQSLNRFEHLLVGRAAELAQIEDLVEAALAGSGRILRLEGVVGIGKSHLVAEAAARARGRGMHTLAGVCQSTSRDIAYTPWRQIFQTLFGLTSELMADGDQLSVTTHQIAQVAEVVGKINHDWLLRLPLLGDLLGLPIPDNATTVAFDPRIRQEALFALVADLVQFWAQAQPMFLLIEDAHWIDEASAGLALALSHALVQAPVVLALAHRPPAQESQLPMPDLTHLPYYHLLHLGELAPEDVAILISHRLHGPPPSLVVSLLQVRTQGNPFYAEELINILRDTGQLYLQEDGAWTISQAVLDAFLHANCLVKSDGQWVLAPNAPLTAVDLRIPDSIHDVVLSRLDRLPQTHKLTLKVASVIGRLFELELLARAHPLKLDQQALFEQIQEVRDFIHLEIQLPRPTYMFTHNITQEVAYDTLLETQRRELHETVASGLENLQPEAIEQLAYHYSRSGVRVKTLFYLDKAASKAQHEYANETALNYYSQALALEERWEWRRGQVEVLHTQGRRAEELVGLRALDTNAAAPVFEGRYLWGQYYEAIGEYMEARAQVERALEVGHGRADIVQEMRCLAQLGLIARRQGDYEAAKVWYHQALALFQDQPPASDRDLQAFVDVLNGLGTVHRQQGDFDATKDYYQRALAASRQHGNRSGEANALHNLGVTAFYQRNFAEALTYHEQALEIRRAIGHRTGEGISYHALAQAIRDAGDYVQAQAYFSAALSIHQATGNRWEEVNVWNDLGILCQELGDLAQAQSCLQHGLELSQAIGDLAGQAYILANLGPLTRDQGNLEVAENLLADGLTLAQAQTDIYMVSYFLSHMAGVSLLAGRLDQAIERASAALTLRRQNDLHLWTTGDLATLASAYLASGNLVQALDYAQQALGILNECGGEGPEAPHRDYFICYQILAAAGEIEAAHAALASAYALVMARAQKLTDPAIRRSFLERVRINHAIVQATSQHLSDDHR